MFASAEECRDYFDDCIDEKAAVVTECEVAIRALNVAHDYLEEVLAERDDGDYLPSSTDRSNNAIFERLTQFAERIGYREEMKERAELSIGDLESERDDLVTDLERREEEAEDAGLDDIEDVE